MTYRFPLLAGLLALALVACVQVAPAAPERKVVVVVDGSAGTDAGLLAEARAAVAAAGAQAELRVPRTPTEQLSVTHYFAARGFDIVGVGLDRRVAVAPIVEHYPGVRITAARPGAIAQTLAAEPASAGRVRPDAAGR